MRTHHFRAGPRVITYVVSAVALLGIGAGTALDDLWDAKPVVETVRARATTEPQPVPTSTPSPTVTPTPTPQAPATQTPPPTRTTRPSAGPTTQPTPGPALLEEGDESRQVRELQVRLRSAGTYSAKVTGFYGRLTEAAVRRFQRAEDLPVSGAVDRATWRALRASTPAPTEEQLEPPTPTPRPPQVTVLDERCLTGRVICIDKTERTLRWVVDGKVRYRMDGRFGGPSTPTREGTFEVYRKSRYHVSGLYGTDMPFAMFFSGGQAVHYSPDFASKGYAGASHGCVNTRSWPTTARLFSDVGIGDAVVVYRS